MSIMKSAPRCRRWPFRRSSPRAPSAFAYKVFVSNEKDNTVSVIDSEKLEVVHTIKVGHRPRGIILGNEGKWVIVCTSDDNVMQVYDTKTYELVKRFPRVPIRSCRSCIRRATRSMSPTRTTTSSPSSTS